MYAMRGTISNNKIITNENLGFYEGRSVIVTILDAVEKSYVVSQSELDKEEAVKAARKLSGLWAAHDIASVDEMVRKMRKVRHFDI